MQKSGNSKSGSEMQRDKEKTAQMMKEKQLKGVEFEEELGLVRLLTLE